MTLEDYLLGQAIPKIEEKPLTLREAGSKAFFELKKHPFCKIEETETEKKAYLFKEYTFTLDSKNKIMWGEFKDRPMGEAFSLCTHQKEWKTLFSFPSRTMQKFISGLKGIKGREVGKHVRIITYQAYKLNTKSMVQIFGGKLWKMYDRDIACMAMKAFGFFANSFDYTLIWNNKEEVFDTHQKAPGIIAIWRDIFLQTVKGEISRSSLLGEISEVEQIIPKTKPEDRWFFKYRNLENWNFPNIIKVVKAFLEIHKLTTAGWKFLLKLSPMHVRKLRFRFHNNWSGFVNYLNEFSKVGVVPRFTLWKKLLDYMYEPKTDSYFAIARAATLHVQKSKKIRDFVDQFGDIMDWYRRGGLNQQRVVLDRNQIKADWNYFVRREQEWQREIAARNIEKEKLISVNLVWTSLVNEVEMDGFKIIPMTSSHDLIEEGSIMKHCVGNGGYDSDCVKNTCRIFSIRQGEERLATLELRCGYVHEKGKITLWAISQCRGRHNAKVKEEVVEVANKVLEEYRKQQKLLENSYEGIQVAAVEGHAFAS